ncbi:MAG: lactate utilization protein [Thermodesulfobacteriota bacterium]
MSTSREEILHRIRQGLSGVDVTIPEHKDLISKAQKVNELILDSKDQLASEFISELEKVNTNLLSAGKESEIFPAILKFAKDRGIKSFSIWESQYLKEMNLKKQLKDEGLKLITAKNKNNIARCDIGITEADYAIADTGTLVLIANKNQPRSVSLIPPIHLAIVRPENLVRNIQDLFVILKSKLQEDEDLTSNMTFITGPSRTADIELNLTLGVHGPKELYVVI